MLHKSLIAMMFFGCLASHADVAKVIPNVKEYPVQDQSQPVSALCSGVLVSFERFTNGADGKLEKVIGHNVKVRGGSAEVRKKFPNRVSANCCGERSNPDFNKMSASLGLQEGSCSAPPQSAEVPSHTPAPSPPKDPVTKDLEIGS